LDKFGLNSIIIVINYSLMNICYL